MGNLNKPLYETTRLYEVLYYLFTFLLLFMAITHLEESWLARVALSVISLLMILWGIFNLGHIRTYESFLRCGKMFRTEDISYDQVGSIVSLTPVVWRLRDRHKKTRLYFITFDRQIIAFLRTKVTII